MYIEKRHDMDWLLDNFGKLLPIVLMVLYFLLNKGKKNAEEEGDGVGAEGSEEADRVKRIQDEIRRRILERQQGEAEDHGFLGRTPGVSRRRHGASRRAPPEPTSAGRAPGCGGG